MPHKTKKLKPLSHVRLFATPCIEACNFPGKSPGVGCHLLFQGIFLKPGIKPGSPALQAEALPLSHQPAHKCNSLTCPGNCLPARKRSSLSPVQLGYPMDCSMPGSSVHARILDWVAVLFSRGSSQPRDLNQGLSHCRQILSLPSEPPGDTLALAPPW